MSATAAPDCASRRAQARPIPCEAPVTSATRPERLMQRSSLTGEAKLYLQPRTGGRDCGCGSLRAKQAAEPERGNPPRHGGHGDHGLSGSSQELRLRSEDRDNEGNSPRGTMPAHTRSAVDHPSRSRRRPQFIYRERAGYENPKPAATRIGLGGRRRRAGGRSPARLHGGNLLAGLDRAANWLVITLVDVDHRAAHEAGASLGMDVRREGESADVGIVLYELHALHKEGRRFHHAAFRTHETAVIGVEINPALEKAGALLARLHLKHVNHMTVNVAPALVRELVVRRSQRGQRKIVLLKMIDFGLQQVVNDAGLDELVSAEAHGFEFESARSHIVAFEFVFS